MKKLRLLCLFLILSVLMLFGCNEASSEETMPQLEQKELDKLKEQIGEDYSIDLYLGEYSECLVWFEAGLLTVVETIVIGEYSFEYGSNFSLNVYNSGKVYDLNDLYDQGVISDDDIKQIYKYYTYAIKTGLI